MDLSQSTGSQAEGEKFDFAIVGMGIGGLAMGALLANAGKKVVIFEQHDAPGGYGQTFQKDGFSFCAHLHYVWDCGPGERVTRMLEKLGLEQQVTFHRLDPDGFDRVVAPGIDYSIGCGFAREHDRLVEMFPEYNQELLQYFDIVSKIHSQAYDLPIGFSWKTVLAHPIRYSAIIRYVNWTLKDLFDYLKLPLPLRTILAGQNAIFCAPPKDLSLIVQAVGVGSYNQGAYYPTKSFTHVMKCLVQKIEKQPDCQTLLSTEITGIEVRDQKVCSVSAADGQTYFADHFLFDGDAQLSLDLIGREHFPRKFRRKLEYKYGPSVVSVYLGLQNIDLREFGFEENNLYWHPKLDLNEVYDDQLSDRIPGRPFFACNAPTHRTRDPSLAPPGCEQLVLASPCRYEFFAELRNSSETAYQKAKQEYADNMIRVIETEYDVPLTDHIVVKEVCSPLTNEHFMYAPHGNCYSTPLDPQHVNLNRLNYRSPFPNFYYVGASSCLPGFGSIIHFACLLYEQLTGDSVY